MLKNKMILAFLTVDFAMVHVWALAESGLSGFFTFLSELPPWGVVLGVDLVIALVMVLSWMFADAKKTGRGLMPFALVTMVSGSFGPLLYQLLRKDEEAPARVPHATGASTR